MQPHSNDIPHAHPQHPADAVCLPRSTSGPSETLSVTPESHRSPSVSSNASADSSDTTILAASSTASRSQEELGTGLPERSLRSRQRNRLQLRNAGFRAAAITSTHRVSPLAIFSSRDTSPTSPQTAVRDRTTSDAQYQESSILQELHKSGRIGRRNNSRPSLSSLFNDPEAESRHSPSTSANMSPRIEYLKRSMGNDENLPPNPLNLDQENSPVWPNSGSSKRGSLQHGKQHRVSRRKTDTAKYRSGSLQVTAYIDSLESEIVSLETRLSTMNSPSMTSGQSSKLRSLTAQNRNLKQEVADWELRFDERVQDAVYERTHFEADLKRQIRELERQLSDRDERQHILEYKAQEGERRAQQAEECEKLMSKRLDVLTSMVAESPDKAVDGWATAPTTPMIKDGPGVSRRARRGHSMLLSPLKTTGPTIRSNSPSRRETMRSAEDVFGWHALDEKDEPPSTRSKEGQADEFGTSLSSLDSTVPSDQQSILSASSQPTSLDFAELRSPTRERPMSLLSSSSFSASWGLPASLGRSYNDGSASASSHDSLNKRVSQAKRMRRFHSSAGGLKPLILPSTSSISSNSVTSPNRTSLLSPSRLSKAEQYVHSAPIEGHFTTPIRNVSGASQESDGSFDPTTAFFDASIASSTPESAETPTLAARRRSKETRELERLKALRLLEGGLTGSIDEMIAEISGQGSQTEDLEAKIGIPQTLPPSAYQSPSPEHLVSTPGSSLADELKDNDWADDLASTPSMPSTPPRSRAASSAETPKALDFCALQMPSAMLDTAPTTPVVQPPRISIQCGTLSPTSLHSEVTETTETPAVALHPDDHPSFLERMAQLASTVLPFQRTGDNSVDTARARLRNSKPVLLAQSIFERSWSRTTDGIGLISPFCLGGLGWWLFGLFNWRARKIRDHHLGYQRVLTRPRQISCSFEERHIGISIEPGDQNSDLSPAELRRLELDGPGECALMRSQPQRAFDERSAMLGLVDGVTPQYRFRSYGSFRADGQVRSAVDRVFGHSHMSCTYCVEPAARRKLRAWAKFGLALVLALGVAILEGPEAAMGETAKHDAGCGHARRDSEDCRDDIEPNTAVEV